MNRTGLFCALAGIGIGLIAVPVIVLGDETGADQAESASSSDSAEVAPLRPGRTVPPSRAEERSAPTPASRASAGIALSDAMTADDAGNPVEAQEAMQAQQAAGLYDPSNTKGPQVGTLAPIFELTPLQQYDYEIELASNNANASDLDPVRLSSFRKNLPVVLIFGSYT